MKKACFICGTPYHVITSIILKYQLNIQADIIVYDAFSNTDVLCANLLNEGIFEGAKVLSRKDDFGLPQDESIIKRYLYAFGEYFKIEKLITRVISNFGDYSDVFFANDQVSDTIDRFIYCYLKKYYSDIKIHFMEDGLGSYHEEYYQLTKLDYLFRRLVVRGKSYEVYNSIYLYSPELFKMINPHSEKIINKIDKPNGFIVEKIKRVFSFVKEDIEQYKIIIFDTVREEEFNKEGIKKYSSLVRKLVGDNNPIVKPHPREKNKFFDYKYFDTEGFPFEILCLYNNFNEYTFINNYSNAVFTPKLIFDQEPKIIFTYKVLFDYMNKKEENVEVMISNLKALYRDSSKIVILER